MAQELSKRSACRQWIFASKVGGAPAPNPRNLQRSDPLNGPFFSSVSNSLIATYEGKVRWDSVPFNFWWTKKEGFQSGPWADYKWSEITLVIIEIFHPLFFDRYMPPEIKLEFLFVYTRWSLGGWIMICLVLSKLWSLFVVALFWRYIQRLWRHLQVYWISLDLPTQRWTFKMSVLVANDFGWFLEVGWWTYS